MSARIFPALLGFLLLFAGASSPAAADTRSDSKTVDGVAIYLGVMPSAMIRGHSASHTEATMHGGVPTASNDYHVLIALFDAKTGARISNAQVRAQVYEVGRTGVEKKLEPMLIAGTTTYGNYFTMAGAGPFRILVTIRIPGKPHEIATEFEHWHREFSQ